MSDETKRTQANVATATSIRIPTPEEITRARRTLERLWLALSEGELRVEEIDSLADEVRLAAKGLGGLKDPPPPMEFREVKPGEDVYADENADV